MLLQAVPSQSEEGVVAVLSESLVLYTRSASHAFNHLLVQLHGRREDLGVTTQDVAKVDVDQVTRLGQEEVVKVTVTDSEKIGDDRVASYSNMISVS